MQVRSGLIGKAGELLVAAELMRRGAEVAMPHADIGVDLIAYKLASGATLSRTLTGIQVKAASAVTYTFHKAWFQKAPFLVWVWNVATTPEFYIFDGVEDVEALIGNSATTSSWVDKGVWHITGPGPAAMTAIQAHRDRWNRIIDAITRQWPAFGFSTSGFAFASFFTVSLNRSELSSLPNCSATAATTAPGLEPH